MKQIAILISCVIFFSCKPKPYNRIAGFAQGTTYSIIYENASGKDYREAIDSLLKAFDMSLSQYEPKSVISRINANEPNVETDEYFKTVFLKSQEIWKESEGSMDITVGPIINELGFGPKNRTVIDTAKIKYLLQFVGFEKVQFKDNRIIKKRCGCKIRC